MRPFYLIQFCDVPRWVAASNVDHWLKDHQAKLDLPYLDRLGSSAYEGPHPGGGFRFGQKRAGAGNPGTGDQFRLPVTGKKTGEARSSGMTARCGRFQEYQKRRAVSH